MGTLQMPDIFHNVQFTVDFASSSLLSFKEKQEIRRNIVDNGGILSYILTKQTNYLVTGNSERTLSSYKGKTATKYGIAVVSFDFVKECVRSSKLLDLQPFLLSETRESQNFSSGKITAKSQVTCSKKQTKIVKKLQLPDVNKIQVWRYKSAEAPYFDEQSCEITKDVLLKGSDSSGGVVTFYALELHVIPPQVPCTGSRYRLFTHHGKLQGLREGDQGTKECRYFSNAGEALGAYAALYTKQMEPLYSLTKVESVLSHKIGSDKMMQMTISEYCSEEHSDITPEVANLIDFIWNEATGSLSDILAIPVDSIKLEDVEKAEAILHLLKKSLDAVENSDAVKNLSDEFFSIIPHKSRGLGIMSRHLIAQKQDLCQLIKDMVSIGESTNWLTRRSVYSKYRALKCHVECLHHGSDEFKKIQTRVNSSETSLSKIHVLNVFSILRPVEEGTFSHDIENKKLLFHSSKVTNFVGILSRGLLLPKIVVDDFGGKRSDAGMLGSGIYFASSASTSAKYSAPGSNGTRLMLVNEVALGNVKEFRKFSMDLTSAPAGCNSCHGVQNTEVEPSDFKDDEFAIYNGNQQRLRYLVEFVLPGDKVLPRDDISLDSGFSDEEIDDVTEDSSVDLSDVMSVVDPLTKVEAGLKGTGDKPIPLQSVHIRAKLLDLAAQVIVFQAYKNTSASPIEAKYVFPLDDMAAVCGFEAFINGKHIIGEVKEKEQAHKEYREAISQGHGAYLMDEETPDVFTVSVGNLPPGAQVLIKITYVTELLVEREHICFTLPGSMAPWKRNKALEEVTQTDVDTVRIDDNGASDLLDLSVQVSVEMPFDIRTIDSPSHPVRIKRTATKAVVLLEPGQSLGDGFQLLIGLAEIHVPRMWVERHVSRPDSQACMLTFYPEFESESSREVEVIFLLDLSCSMKGPPLEEAKKILLMCLTHLNKAWTFNILVFGSKHSELFPISKRNDKEAYREAVEFVQSLSATKGSTELWRVLQKLYLLPAISAADHPRNLFLISDGHVTEEETTLDLIRRNYQSDRVFTFGVGSAANRYLLRSMSKVGAGASEFFDSKAKSKWERKVKWQLSKAEQPGLTSVAVTWQQHDSGSSPPVQAPHQIVSLFNGSRQVVYGFVDNSTQATLTAEVNGKTVSTMVSTADLNITTGKILHQLTARGLIRDWDEGSLHDQRTGHEVVKRNRKDYIISISKEFSVVSKFTSFVAVEHREKDEKFEEGLGPSIYDLVAAEEVDILQYIGWEQKPDVERKREPSTEEKLEKQLEEAKVLETCAVLQCERLYHDVMKEARDKLGSEHALTAKTVYALSNLYKSLMGDKNKARQVLEDNGLAEFSSKSDDWPSSEWSETDESWDDWTGEAAQEDQEVESPRSSTSRSGTSSSGEESRSTEEEQRQDKDEGEKEEEGGLSFLRRRIQSTEVVSMVAEKEKSVEKERQQEDGGVKKKKIKNLALFLSESENEIEEDLEELYDDVGDDGDGDIYCLSEATSAAVQYNAASPRYSATSPQYSPISLSPLMCEDFAQLQMNKADLSIEEQVQQQHPSEENTCSFKTIRDKEEKRFEGDVCDGQLEPRSDFHETHKELKPPPSSSLFQRAAFGENISGKTIFFDSVEDISTPLKRTPVTDSLFDTPVELTSKKTAASKHVSLVSGEESAFRVLGSAFGSVADKSKDFEASPTLPAKRFTADMPQPVLKGFSFGQSAERVIPVPYPRTMRTKMSFGSKETPQTVSAQQPAGELFDVCVPPPLPLSPPSHPPGALFGPSSSKSKPFGWMSKQILSTAVSGLGFGGGLFGVSPPPPPPVGLSGSSSSESKPFSSISKETSSTGGSGFSFGQSQQTAGGLVGVCPPPPPSGGLFGSSSSESKPLSSISKETPSTGVSGFSFGQSQQPAGGLFGVCPPPPPPPPGGLFGSSSSESKPLSSISKQTPSSGVSGFSFGQSQQPAGGLFRVCPPPPPSWGLLGSTLSNPFSQTPQPPIGRSELFGVCQSAFSPPVALSAPPPPAALFAPPLPPPPPPPAPPPLIDIASTLQPRVPASAPIIGGGGRGEFMTEMTKKLAAKAKPQADEKYHGIPPPINRQLKGAILKKMEVKGVLPKPCAPPPPEAVEEAEAICASDVSAPSTDVLQFQKITQLHQTSATLPCSPPPRLPPPRPSSVGSPPIFLRDSAVFKIPEPDISETYVRPNFGSLAVRPLDPVIPRATASPRQQLLSSIKMRRRMVQTLDSDRESCGGAEIKKATDTSFLSEEKLREIFAKQNPEGFWNVDDLSVIGISKTSFIVFLAKAGAKSLGPRVFEDVLRILSTLVMFAFINFRLFIAIPFKLPREKTPEVMTGGLCEPYTEDIMRALKWIKIQEQKIPLLCSRLELGVNWETATFKMLNEINV